LLEIGDFFTTLLYGGEYSLGNPVRAYAQVVVFMLKIKEMREFVVDSQMSKEIWYERYFLFRHRINLPDGIDTGPRWLQSDVVEAICKRAVDRWFAEAG
jgi:hypothetical protein